MEVLDRSTLKLQVERGMYILHAEWKFSIDNISVEFGGHLFIWLMELLCLPQVFRGYNLTPQVFRG